MKIKDLSIDQLKDYCIEREDCKNCPFNKNSTCLSPEYILKRRINESLSFLTNKQYEEIGNTDI